MILNNPGISGIPHTGLKKEALNIMLILINKLKAKEPTTATAGTEMAMVRQTFEQIATLLQKDAAPEVKCRLKDIEDKLK